jgi:DnaK suppressor protein
MSNTKSTTRDLKQVQAKLREQLQELQHRLSLVVQQGRQSGTTETQDVADQAVASYEKEILFTHGAYGTCQRCQATIGAKRLEALPWTPYCLSCQEHLESQADMDRELAAS